MSTQELGALLGVTRQTIRNWIKKGDIQAFHIGQSLKVSVQEATRILGFYELPIPDWMRQQGLSASEPSGEERPQWHAKGTDKTGFPGHVPPSDGRFSETGWTRDAQDDW